MTDAQDAAAIAQHVFDAWDGSLRLVHITVSDEDGDAYPGQDIDRWVIDVRVPITDDESEAVSVAKVTAFTTRAPESLAAVAAAYAVVDVAGDFKSALAIHDRNGRPFFELVESAAELLHLPDLLTIDQVTIGAAYRDLPGLAPRVVSAISNGPAGRTAAFVVIDPTVWNVNLTDEDQEFLGFSVWADTTVLVAMNADPQEAAQIAADTLAVNGPAGTRSMTVALGEALEHAWTGGAVAVPFTLPPKLPANVWAGASEDIHEVRADERTGSITIVTHTTEYEVVGAPGTAPQLVGVAAEAEPQVREWLRAVHQRWWQYEPDLHIRIHEVIDGYLTTGTIDRTDDETVEHLHAPDVPNPDSPWPGAGEVHLQSVSDEPTEPAVFDAVLATATDHEHIGAVILHEGGQLHAFLHDTWNPNYPEPDAAVQHLASLAAAQYFANAIHEELSAGVEHNLLTSDVRGH